MFPGAETGHAVSVKSTWFLEGAVPRCGWWSAGVSIGLFQKNRDHNRDPSEARSFCSPIKSRAFLDLMGRLVSNWMSLEWSF